MRLRRLALFLSCGGPSSATYVLGLAALVVVIDPGDRPGGSAVHAVDEVILRPPIPEDALAALTGVPEGLPILGFARVPEGCLPLGRLRVTSHSSAWAPDRLQSTFEDCHLSIENPLPFPAPRSAVRRQAVRRGRESARHALVPKSRCRPVRRSNTI